MNNVSGSSVVKGAAVYSLVQALLSLCGAATSLGVGALVNTAQLTAEEQDALAASGAVTGLLSILGIIFGIVGIVMLVNAFGLWTRKSWAWMLTVGVFGVNVVLSVLGWLGGSFTTVSLGTTLISAVIVYFFLTNAEVKSYLGKV
jgi:uncharacterized membrane protein HdeD (DUF308 family)